MIKILITGTFWRQLKVTDENKAILSINGLKLDNKSVLEFGGFWLFVRRGHEPAHWTEAEWSFSISS